MSVKFEKEVTTKTTEAVANAATAAGVTEKGKDDILRDVGEALTKGGGANGYLAVRRAQLNHFMVIVGVSWIDTSPLETLTDARSPYRPT